MNSFTRSDDSGFNWIIGLIDFKFRFDGMKSIESIDSSAGLGMKWRIEPSSVIESNQAHRFDIRCTGIRATFERGNRKKWKKSRNRNPSTWRDTNMEGTVRCWATGTDTAPEAVGRCRLCCADAAGAVPFWPVR